jgi:hypothetical protein
LQELWDVCHGDECLEPEVPVYEEQEAAQVCMAISMVASTRVQSVNAIQFLGNVHGLRARILVDSGSSHTFFSQSLAEKLYGMTTFSPPLHVTVANGSVLNCSAQFLNLSWAVQDYQFQSTAKVLPLSQYELIVGMDWLSAHSPMEID